MATDAQLDEQIDYYRAIANEYEQHVIDAPGGEELRAAFDSFEIVGDVLELAWGPGIWTSKLALSADSLTAVDVSPEMIERAKSRVAGRPVDFVQADLFSWQPDRRYDSVFFGFWLSHVPRERFDAFWQLVVDCLKPGGSAFFVDDNHRTSAELIEGDASPIVERRLNDGSTFRAIKVPYQATELERELHRLGWSATTGSSGPFYWGRAARL